MKNKPITLLSAPMLALWGFLLLTPHGMAAEKAAEKDNLKASDVRFIRGVAVQDMAEVKLAELGVKKAAKPEVKSYADMIVTDHAKAQQELKALAAGKGVELSNVPDSKLTTTYQELEKCMGSDFDNKFLTEMVRRHKESVSDFEEASTMSRDVDVRAFAGEMLPTRRAHFKKCLELSPVVPVVKKEPDNTARNVRDRSAGSLTPLDQGSSKNDTEITAQIRKEIIAAKDVSLNARNVKIITLNGRVTLRGPVNNAEEKRLIVEIAGRIVRADHVDCQLEVK